MRVVKSQESRGRKLRRAVRAVYERVRMYLDIAAAQFYRAQHIGRRSKFYPRDYTAGLFNAYIGNRIIIEIGNKTVP